MTDAVKVFIGCDPNGSEGDLAALFDRYLHDALAAGYTLDSYRTDEAFGPIVKESQKNYISNRTYPKQSFWSRLIRRKR